MQITPVTQHQWVRVMKKNPSKYYGFESEEVVISNNKIYMRADAPVESIDRYQVRDFINYLDKKDTLYSYALPSIDEYDALLQASRGKKWPESIPEIDACRHSGHPCRVSSGLYYECNGKRMWHLIGNIWQFTRDKIDMNGPQLPADLVFGGSFETKKEMITLPAGIVRPIFYRVGAASSIGLRLVRFKKGQGINHTLKIYTRSDFAWTEEHQAQDSNWKWENTFNSLIFADEMFEFMKLHKESYSPAIQRTLDVIVNDHCGFGNCKYLRELRIDRKDIEDILPISLLTNLERLELPRNKIKNIAPLAQLTKLKWLNLNNNQIADVSSLAKLTDLTELDLNTNRIESVSALSQLIDLKDLRLGYNLIEDTWPLAQLTNLTVLGLESNQVKNIQKLSQLTQLEWLNLSNNRIQNITACARLLNLKWLYLKGNLIRDVSALAQLIHLEELSLDENHLEDVSSLGQLFHLRLLGLMDNRIKNLPSFPHLKNAYIPLDGNPLAQALNKSSGHYADEFVHEFQ